MMTLVAGSWRQCCLISQVRYGALTENVFQTLAYSRFIAKNALTGEFQAHGPVPQVSLRTFLTVPSTRHGDDAFTGCHGRKFAGKQW